MLSFGTCINFFLAQLRQAAQPVPADRRTRLLAHGATMAAAVDSTGVTHSSDATMPDAPNVQPYPMRPTFAASPPQPTPPTVLEQCYDIVVQAYSSLVRRYIFSNRWDRGAARLRRLASMYLTFPETDGWGVVSTTLSIVESWFRVDAPPTEVDNDLKIWIAAALLLAYKSQREDGWAVRRVAGVNMPRDVIVLGTVLGETSIEWQIKIAPQVAEFERIICEAQIRLCTNIPLLSHTNENAQNVALHQLTILFDAGHLSKDLSFQCMTAVSFFYRASILDNVLFVTQREDVTADAIILATLACSTTHRDVSRSIAPKQTIANALLLLWASKIHARRLYTGYYCESDCLVSSGNVESAIASLQLHSP